MAEKTANAQVKDAVGLLTKELTAGKLAGSHGAGVAFQSVAMSTSLAIQDGTDYLRRLRPDGELTEWPGVSNLDMGEVKVLKPLTVIAAGAGPEQEAAQPQPSAVEGLGEVALTYTCCEMCGCFADDPQGVARLDEASMQTPLPFVIIATITDGDGPFGHIVADAGPQGLTWGEDRVLYVGNSTQNGELNSADLELMTQEVLTPLPERIHAAAAVSPVHLLVAVEGGDVYRYNTEVGAATFLVALGSDVTALAHDAFTGLVHASLQNLEIVTVHPFTGEVTPFDVMPAIGRVAVSPNGQLWYAPAKYIAGNLPLTAWALPSEF